MASTQVFLKSTSTWRWDGGAIICSFVPESISLHFPALLCTAREWTPQTTFPRLPWQLAQVRFSQWSEIDGWEVGWGEKPCLQTFYPISPPSALGNISPHLLCGSTPAGQLLLPWSNSSQVTSVVDPVLIGQPWVPESGNSISSFGLSSLMHHSD